jgi:hypothetical protein
MTRIEKTARLAAILLALAAASPAAFAEPARRGLVLDQSLQAGYNPLGAQLVTKLYCRLPLIEKEGILWESTKVDLGIKNSLSPAYDMLGFFVDIEPIAVFDLALSASAIGYFDALGFGFRSMAGYDAAFDDAALKAVPDGNALGYQLAATPTFKIALGPFAVLDSLSATYFSVDGGSGYFLEAMGNCVLKKEDFELFNDAYALYAFDFGLMVGVNDSILYVPGSGYRSHTLQGIGVYSGRLSEKADIYAALTAGIYLEDKYYEGKPRAAGQAGITLKL